MALAQKYFPLFLSLLMSYHIPSPKTAGVIANKTHEMINRASFKAGEFLIISTAYGIRLRSETLDATKAQPKKRNHIKVSDAIIATMCKPVAMRRRKDNSIVL